MPAPLHHGILKTAAMLSGTARGEYEVSCQLNLSAKNGGDVLASNRAGSRAIFFHRAVRARAHDII